MERNPAYGINQEDTIYINEPPTADEIYDIVDDQTIQESAKEEKCTGTVYEMSKTPSSPKVGLMMGIAVTTAVLALVVAVVAVVLNPVLNSGYEIQSLTKEIERIQMNLSQAINTIEKNGYQLNLNQINSSQEIQSLELKVEREIEMLQLSLNRTMDNNIKAVILNPVLNSSQDIESLALETERLRLSLNQTVDMLMELSNKISTLQSNIQTQYATELPTFTQPPPPDGSFENPVNSCSVIPTHRSSGLYWIQTESSPVQVYCDMNKTCCNSTTGGWTRVANLDMTKSSQQCPSGYRLVTRTTAPLRICYGTGNGCVSTTFSSYGIEYSRVCGRVIGYQESGTSAFLSYYRDSSITIDDNYLAGVSLTHGQSPRQHIWSFAAAVDETRANAASCPCSITNTTYSGIVPPFVGQDYFCETGSRGNWVSGRFYSEDPLWNGQGCGSVSTCCSFNNPPWFCKQLPQPTTDDIELRLCYVRDSTPKDIALEIAEIYIR